MAHYALFCYPPRSADLGLVSSLYLEPDVRLWVKEQYGPPVGLGAIATDRSGLPDSAGPPIFKSLVFAFNPVLPNLYDHPDIARSKFHETHQQCIRLLATNSLFKSSSWKHVRQVQVSVVPRPGIGVSFGWESWMLVIDFVISRPMNAKPRQEGTCNRQK